MTSPYFDVFSKKNNSTKLSMFLSKNNFSFQLLTNFSKTPSSMCGKVLNSPPTSLCLSPLVRILK